jgi:hypothetical protein
MPKTGKNRLHFDLAPPVHGDRQIEVDRLLSLGATRIDTGQAEVSWVAMADPDGNEFCVVAVQPVGVAGQCCPKLSRGRGTCAT